MKTRKFSSESIQRKEIPSNVFFLHNNSHTTGSSGINGDLSESVQKNNNGLDEEKNNRDKILWSKMKEGDITALGNLYDLYIDELFPFGLKICTNKILVLDCIHDLFVDLFKYKKKLASSPQVKYYLLLSLKRKILKKTSKKDKSLAELDDKNLIELNLFETSAEKKIIENEIDGGKKKLVSRALDGLPKKQKLAIQLKFYEGKSYEEIAAFMNITIETARTLIYRSILSLRKTLNDPFILILLILRILQNSF